MLEYKQTLCGGLSIKQSQSQNQKCLYQSRKREILCVTAAKWQLNITINNNESKKKKGWIGSGDEGYLDAE